jgi:hypothetical protein
VPLSREECLSREEELDKELVEDVHLHEEEVAIEFPLCLPPMPSPRTSRTALFDLMAYGLVDSDAFQQLQQVDEGTFLNEVIHLIQREKAHEFFYRAFGAWMVRDTSQDVDVIDGNANTLTEMKELCTEGLKTLRNIEFWSNAIRHTWVYMKNSREWIEYDQQAKAMHKEVDKKHDQYMKDQVAAFEGAMAIDREAVKWDFNAVVSLLRHESHRTVHPPAFALDSLRGGGKRSDPPTYDGYI